MRASDIFKGKSLKAEDIQGRDPIVTIESISLQTFDDNTTKPVIKFRNAEKQLVCNKTNWNAIVDITGEEDSDNWTGKKIRLVVAKVDFQGKRVPAIRVEDPNPRRAAVSETVEAPGEDDIPF